MPRLPQCWRRLRDDTGGEKTAHPQREVATMIPRRASEVRVVAVAGSILMGLILARGAQGEGLPRAVQDERVRVEVVDSANNRSVVGARVFILSEAGTELVSSSSDAQGIARLPVVAESERPKYLLVEHPAFFLSGMRWQPGLMEYYIPVMVLKLR